MRSPLPLAILATLVLSACSGQPAKVNEEGYAVAAKMALPAVQALPQDNTEEYGHIRENSFQSTADAPLSTFSIDVDTASYANVRRFLAGNQLPPKDAVRLEELVNYFDYQYPEPEGNQPFTFVTELGAAPWNPDHQLLQIGLKAKSVDLSAMPPANLVFLIDVSGSMDAPNRLPLVKSSLKLLVERLRPEDRVSIVVYAGQAGLVLPSTSGAQKQTIVDALDRLSAGGSTAGGQGIQLAYKVAQENFLPRGNNRVILCTDGDFNVGVSSTGQLVELIEEKRRIGVFLTVLGYGMGNYKDDKMARLSKAGNGNYAYVDTMLEARKVLVEQLGGTLLTLAKDVKLQVEFNPAKVSEYRLLGYENRMLSARDFHDDTKDAGEMGAGHTVTALYELVPAGKGRNGGELRYQEKRIKASARNHELAEIKFRYKPPQGDQSQLAVHVIADTPMKRPSADFRLASAVAEWAMLLRDSPHKGRASYQQVQELLAGALAHDPNGYRHELKRLVALSADIRK